MRFRGFLGHMIMLLKTVPKLVSALPELLWALVHDTHTKSSDELCKPLLGRHLHGKEKVF